MQKDTSKRSVLSGNVSWSPPPPGCIKVNFDGALLHGGSALGLGIIARDTAGRCLTWASWKLNRGGSAEETEAYAAREAVLLARRKQWDRVIFEGDCTSLLTKISTTHTDYSIVGPLVVDIRLGSAHFESVFFSFVRRLSNSVADFLSCYELEGEGDSSDLPPGLDSVLLGDLAR
ncbi:UNVERIFIED_CONTAM: hypothetical protein Sradi_2059900 [Sesamum radiatum]|uniref:RNase H type-1 domain-containing protein n=1 Tax=Sesamum radiatum TaxID=300843 RepID=A0AAW2TKT9_SESRA